MEETILFDKFRYFPPESCYVHWFKKEVAFVPQVLFRLGSICVTHPSFLEHRVIQVRCNLAKDENQQTIAIINNIVPYQRLDREWKWLRIKDGFNCRAISLSLYADDKQLDIADYDIAVSIEVRVEKVQAQETPPPAPTPDVKSDDESKDK